MVSRFAAICILSALALAGCASKPPSQLDTSRTAYAPASEPGSDEAARAGGRPFSAFEGSEGPASYGRLAGRTLKVASISDIRLNDKELVLTFDDGPIPGRTDRILEVLARYRVKATFLMVGQMANSYPALASRVVREGHSVGSHTYNHANLAAANNTVAMTEITNGNAAVRRATGVTVGFFRFPYLADTAALRRAVAHKGLVILDTDIDSKDYFSLSPATIAEQTMAKIRARRKGIILMHDIHGRTAAMLPLLLTMMQAEGYKVVKLQYRGSLTPDALVSAEPGKPAAEPLRL